MQLINRRLVIVAGIVITGLLSCARAPLQMNYFIEQAPDETALLWPGLPEVPRYRYAGQLLGDRNFSAAESQDPGAFTSMLKWIAGLGDENGYENSLLRPQSGMVSGDRTYVTDVGRGAVYVFDSAVAELQIWSLADDNSHFISPVGITDGADGSLLVADSELKRIVRLSGDGRPLGSFGRGQLSRPTGIARDQVAGRTYVVDTHAHNIKVYNDKGDLLDIIGRRGIGEGEFNSPTHIAIHGGRLYVSDTLNARVQILTLDGSPLGSIGKRGLYLGNFTRPKGITVGADGNIYVVESYHDHLLVYDEAGNFLLPIGGSGKNIGEFYLPAGAWSDDHGRIYVADMYNGRVIIFQYLGS